jgi:hypothetical protein
LHASQPTKVFQPFKTKIFKGVRGEKGAKARRFVKTLEMYRDSTPGMTQSQMGVTMYANMDDSAKDWVHAEDEEYKRQNGGVSLLHNWEALRRKFLERWGEVNPAKSLECLENLAQGKDEEVASLASRARELFEEAHQYDEKIKIHKFMKALHAPLQQGLQTRGADTFERAVKVAIELEDGIWAMSDYKSPRAEKQGGDTVCLAKEETPRVNSLAVCVPPAPTARPDPRGDLGRSSANRGRGQGRRRNEGRARECYNCRKMGHFARACTAPDAGCDKVQRTYGSRVESPYDGVDLNIEFADQGTIRVASSCAGFGWKHEPFLDLGDDEEESIVTTVKATGAQLLDASGARQAPHGPRAGPSLGPPVEEGTAPSQISTTPAAPAQPPRTIVPDIGGMTDDAKERTSFAPPAAISPTMTGTLPMEWAPMEKGIKHGSPSLSRNMASTMHKVGRMLCEGLAPWRPIHNGAISKAHGNELVASSWLDTATCVRETGAAEVEDVFGGVTLVYAMLVPREGEEERGFLRLRDPVIIPGPKELERHDAELSNADKEGGEEEAMEAAAQPVEDEEFSAEENMGCLPEDDAKIFGASMEAVTLLAAEEGGGTSAGIDTARGPASLNPSAGGATTEPRRPCAAQSYKEVSMRAAQAPLLLPAGTEPFIGEKSYAQAIFERRIYWEFFFRKGSAPPTYDPPGGASSDAALDDLLTQKAKYNSTMRDKTEPSKILSTGSSGTQQVYETRKKEQNEYAEHGISRLHDVGRHLTDLVVKRLIMTARRPKA